jgi:hypothetical protein
MKDFIIFFDGQEGTSPLVRLLNNFEQISVIHQANGKVWEPFERHIHGHMSLKNLKACLYMIFGSKPTDFSRLNRIYLETAKNPLEKVDTTVSTGFKMRFVAPDPVLPFSNAFPSWNRGAKAFITWQYRRLIFDVLRKKHVTVFLAVRQDLLRWGLSRYGWNLPEYNGEARHSQFKGTRGKTSSLHVDCSRLEGIITECKQAHERKRRLLSDLRSAGISAHVIRYEDFLDSREKYLLRFLDLLEIEASASDVQEALSKGTRLRKVHPHAIAEFVTNHEEVLERIGSPFVSWA